MTLRHSFESLRRGMSAQSQERAEAKANVLRAEMNLAELRHAAQLSQVQLGDALGIGQAAVAKIEKRTDMFVSTLRRVIRGMGGDLEVAAIFAGRRVIIEQFQNLSQGTSTPAKHIAPLSDHSSSNPEIVAFLGNSSSFVQQFARPKAIHSSNSIQGVHQQPEFRPAPQLFARTAEA
jgi:DNA-binding XRE family transcriptional regulator